MHMCAYVCMFVRMYVCRYILYTCVIYRIAFSVDTLSDMSTCACETNISAGLSNAVFWIIEAKPDFDNDSQTLNCKRILSTYQINTHQQTWVTLPFSATLCEAAGTPAPLREVPKKRWHSAEPEWRNANRAGKILEDSCGSGTSLMGMILGPTQLKKPSWSYTNTQIVYTICLF